MAFEDFLASLPQFLEAPDESGGVSQTQAQPSNQARASREPSLDEILATQNRIAAPTSVGRKDPCPCGSGRKFKACCAKAQA